MAEAISVDGVRVCIALPCYGGYVPVEMALTFGELVPILNRHGVTLSVVTERGNSLPTTARNNLLHQFMETDSEYIFWIDDDILFTPQDFLQILALTLTRKSVAATYPCRKDEPVFFIKPINNDTIEFNEDGLIPCKGVGMGFSCQHRSLLEPLLDKADSYEDKEGTILKDVFKAGVVNGKFQGEDMYFFNELYKNGHTTFIHPLINLKHVGRKDYDHRLMTEKGDLNGCSS